MQNPPVARRAERIETAEVGMTILSQNQGDNQNSEYRYFVVLPNIIDDLPLSLAAFRLYVHIRRVAGDNGVCWQSLTTLAQHCGLSRPTVVRAKKELERLGLVKIVPKKRERGGHDLHLITVVNIWEINHAHYSNDGNASETSQSKNFETSKVNNFYLARENILPLQSKKTLPKEKPIGKENPNEEEPITATAVAFTRILKIFESELITLMPHQKRELKGFVDSLSEEAITAALKDAVMHNKRQWPYIRAILKRYQRDGFQPLQDRDNGVENKTAEAAEARGQKLSDWEIEAMLQVMEKPKNEAKEPKTEIAVEDHSTIAKPPEPPSKQPNEGEVRFTGDAKDFYLRGGVYPLSDFQTYEGGQWRPATLEEARSFVNLENMRRRFTKRFVQLVEDADDGGDNAK